MTLHLFRQAKYFLPDFSHQWEGNAGDDDKKLEDVNRNVDGDDDKRLEDVNRNVCAKSGMPEAHRA